MNHTQKTWEQISIRIEKMQTLFAEIVNLADGADESVIIELEIPDGYYGYSNNLSIDWISLAAPHY